MKTLLAVAGTLILFGGCSKSESVESKVYSGVFVLNSPIDVPVSGRLSVKFTGVNFAGPGDSAVFPYVGTGVFKLSGDSIYFTQTGAVPNTLGRNTILEGGFLLERNDDSLLFSRKSPTGTLSEELFYRLKRQ